MRDPTLSAYLVSVNKIVADHYNDHTVTSALQRAIWFNSTAFAGQEGLAVPQPYTCQWQGMDHPERYQQHLEDPDSAARLAANGWLDQSISYTVNSWGFRSDREYDLVQEPCIVALGCSFTYGTGLHEHQTWPSILARRLGVSLVNLAVPGHGLDLSSLWLLLKGHGIANPLAVCVHEPPAGRISWMQHQLGNHEDPMGPVTGLTLRNMFDNGNWTSRHLLKNAPAVDKTATKMLNDLLLNSSIHNIKNFQLISSWAQSRSVPLFWDNNRTNNFTSVARDLAHWGWEWHSAKADWFLTQINT
jgi:hypothetical protein